MLCLIMLIVQFREAIMSVLTFFLGDLIAIVRRREDESDRLKREVKYLNSQLRELRDESRRMELDLLQELDMLHDKNSVMR